MQSVSIPSRHGVGRKFQQLPNRFESMLMPDFQHDDFTLFNWELRQTTHRRAFLGRFLFTTFEPTTRFQFARQSPPKTAPKIERPIPKTAQTIMNRLLGRLGSLHQTQERFLQNVFGLVMAQPQRP